MIYTICGEKIINTPNIPIQVSSGKNWFDGTNEVTYFASF